MTSLSTLGLVLSALALLPACASMNKRLSPVSLQQQVVDAERAFARTMAARDHAAFTAWLSEEAIFFSGEVALRGKKQVADAWKRFYETPEAPFSWGPERVEVLDSGTLALSTGPVRDPEGTAIATFTSIWRLERPGVWRIIFDKGGPISAKP